MQSECGFGKAGGRRICDESYAFDTFRITYGGN